MFCNIFCNIIYLVPVRRTKLYSGMESPSDKFEMAQRTHSIANNGTVLLLMQGVGEEDSSFFTYAGSRWGKSIFFFYFCATS